MRPGRGNGGRYHLTGVSFLGCYSLVAKGALKLLCVTDRCRVANMILESEFSGLNHDENKLQSIYISCLRPMGVTCERKGDYKWN
jgi:hypothetical protein